MMLQQNVFDEFDLQSTWELRRTDLRVGISSVPRPELNKNHFGSSVDKEYF